MILVGKVDLDLSMVLGGLVEKVYLDLLDLCTKSHWDLDVVLIISLDCFVDGLSSALERWHEGLDKLEGLGFKV